MSKCTAFPYVRTKDGMKRSKFFMDLLHFGRTREQAKEDYYIGTNEEFLKLAGDLAEFDENGEITYESYNNLVGIDTNEDNLLKILEKDTQVGTYTYDEAVGRMQQFNTKNPHRNKYLATIVPNGNKYHLRIVKNTPTEVAALEKALRNQHIQNSIISRLKELHVSVDFLEDQSDIAGRYSTVNAVQTNDALYNLIQISKGESVTPILAEEAGHFVVGALGNDPLVHRLEQSLSKEEVRNRIFKDEDKVIGPNPAREAAGVLVGKALIDEVLNDNFIDKLVSRIALKARKIFASVTYNSVKYNVARAEEYARQMAHGFMSESFTGSVENALERQETLYEAPKGTATRAFRKLVMSINDSLREFRAIDANDKLAKNTSSILKETLKNRRWELSENPDTFGKHASLDGILTALEGYMDLIGPGKDIDRMLSSIDIKNDSNFLPRQVEYGNKLHQINVFLETGYNIIKAVNIEVNDLNSDAAGDQLNRINGLMKEFQTALDTIAKEADILNRNYFCRFCEQIYGKKFIETSRRLVFTPIRRERDEGSGRMVKKGGGKVLHIEEGKQISFESQVKELDSDISGYERLFASMSNNSDIIGQVVDMTTRIGRSRADSDTNASWDYLRILGERWEKLGLGRDQAILFEKDDNGLYTGNIISELNWGKWENARQAEKDRLWNEFITDLKNNGVSLSSMSEVQASLQFEANYLKPGMKAWNRRHSYWDAANSRWIPAKGQVHQSDGSVREDYTNSQFYEVMNNPNLSEKKRKELKNWYEDYLEMKWDLDKELPPGATLPYRLPQFRANFTNKMRNKRNTIGKAAARKGNVRKWALETFCATGEDYDFGYLGTINSIDEDYYRDAGVVAANQPRRLSIFGVNRIKDTNDLSTDLGYSTLCYAAMAHSYKQLDTCIDALEVGKRALSEREVAGKKESVREGTKSGSYRRYIDFIDKVVYGISVRPDLNDWFHFNKVIPEKIVSFITAMGAKLFLGFNYIGGMVNTGTGILEIFKESMVGDFINFKDVCTANRLYFFGDKEDLRNPKSRVAFGLGSFVENWMDFGKQAKDNKISLFCREFDVDSKNSYRYRDWHTTHSGLYNMFSQMPFLGYSSGDHYMQSISYIALAHGVKLYDADGKETDLYHAYKLVDNVDSKGNEKGKKLELGTYFKSREGIQEYALIESIEQKLANAGSRLSILSGGLRFSPEEQQYLDDHNIRVVNLDNAKVQLKELKEKLIWNDDDKTAFQTKAREVNNRLHGIYDRQNSVGFSNTWWGNALLSMRGWMLGWAQRRFATDHYSMALGQNVEGSTITLAKLIAYAMNGPKEDLGTLRQRLGRMAMILLTGGFGENTKRRMESFGLSDFQQGNIRRNAMDMFIMTLLLIIKMITAEPPKEERDKSYEPDLTKGWIYYLTGRLQLEQGAFAWQTPVRMWNEGKQNLHIIPSGFEAGADVLLLLYQTMGLAWADKGNSDIYYQSSKKGKYEKGDTKALAHFIRYTPLRNWYTIENPYDAYKSYETFTLNKR